MNKEQKIELTKEQAIALSLVLAAKAEQGSTINARINSGIKPEGELLIDSLQHRVGQVKDGAEYIHTHSSGNEYIDLATGYKAFEVDKKFSETLEMVQKANPNISEKEARGIAFKSVASQFMGEKVFEKIYEDLDPKSGTGLDDLGKSIQNRVAGILGDAIADDVRDKLIECSIPEKKSEIRTNNFCYVNQQFDELMAKSGFVPTVGLPSRESNYGIKNPELNPSSKGVIQPSNSHSKK